MIRNNHIRRKELIIICEINNRAWIDDKNIIKCEDDNKDEVANEE